MRGCYCEIGSCITSSGLWWLAGLLFGFLRASSPFLVRRWLHDNQVIALGEGGLVGRECPLWARPCSSGVEPETSVTLLRPFGCVAMSAVFFISEYSAVHADPSAYLLWRGAQEFLSDPPALHSSLWLHGEVSLPSLTAALGFKALFVGCVTPLSGTCQQGDLCLSFTGPFSLRQL